ncbi:MAG: hypothetical protein ACR2H3_09655 [Acidimicrobiales bacterium]
MHVVIAPVASDSALAWLDHARKVLSVAADQASPVTVPADVREAFEHYLDQWMWTADAHPIFAWSGSIDPEMACHLVHHWQGLARWVSGARHESPVLTRPKAGNPFYAGLVSAVADALTHDDCTHSFGEDLLADWPDLPEV